MVKLKQLSLFGETEETEIEHEKSLILSEAGTFKESLRAPVHSWFKYPAGYSNEFVNNVIQRFNLKQDSWLYDPFSGSGTTIICAKQRNINGYGVEAHSFVHWVASVKLYWEFDYSTLLERVNHLLSQMESAIYRVATEAKTDGVFPELVYKCYHPQTLRELFVLREFIAHQIDDLHLRDLLKLALTDTLRTASAAGTGWPYIAPNKNTGDKPPKQAYRIFSRTVRKMCSDLMQVGTEPRDCEIRNILGDSREEQALGSGQVNVALTSPPYLNNYDYADRTRLETYFWGITQSWKDITELYRNKLMVAATTQIVRRDHNVQSALSRDVRECDAESYEFIQSAILELSSLRLKRGGKKDYDLMVALYFNDLLKVVKETYRVLRPGGYFCIVLGDSAPYGVHIPTERLVGRLGLGVGFSGYSYEEFRQRGGKWKENPQRHTVQLREGIVVLRK